MKKIFVTEPSLPPLGDLQPYLEDIWKSKWVTNNSKYHREFEKALSNFLGVKYVSLFSNGTLALIIALKALELEGEVITTPFSFVATSSAILWSKLEPVFCDIEDQYYNLAPDKIEESITEKTSAILPVHVYGNPCDVDKIQSIADKYNLKVIYDAAHAFNVKVNNNSILNYGDLSVLSFHGTKVFNTFEGGAIISHTKIMKDKIDKLKNFGFENEVSVMSLGINAKMNEFQSALGLLQLNYVQEYINKRNKITDLYRKNLSLLPGLLMPDEIEGVIHNYSYFPVFIDKETFGISRDDLYAKLKENNIFTRRYFYPLITDFEPYKNKLSDRTTFNVAEKCAQQVLCLPIYPDLSSKVVLHICSCIQGYK